MKSKPTYSVLLALGLAVAFAPVSYAQWLTHTALPGPSPGATDAMFPFQTGGYAAYAGTVHTTTKLISDGISIGTPGISPNPFTNLTSLFAANGYTTNSPGNTFDLLNVASNDTDDIYKVTFDFSGLALGYLPAGSLIAFLDVDINENVDGLRARDSSGVLIGNAWLSAKPPVFDYNAAIDAFPGQEAAVSLSGGTYDLNGQSINPDSLFQGFTTTQNIRSFTFTYDHTQTPPGIGGGGYGIAIDQIPEPSSIALALIGGVGGLIAYRRSSRNLA